MRIDRSNYEIWLIDWLDGNLNDIQAEELQLFLAENPDLKEEFDDLAMFRLNPSEMIFKAKNHLKKTPADLSESEVEYLSVAYLENDLSADQLTELEEAVGNDPEKKRLFELIQKMKLTPVKVTYKNKDRLIRRISRPVIIRLSLIGLAAAAITALVLITYFSTPQAVPVKSQKNAQTIVADTSIRNPAIAKATDSMKEVRKIVSSRKPGTELPAVIQKNTSVISESIISSSWRSDSLARPPENSYVLLNRISVSPSISLKTETISNSLIAFKSDAAVPVYDDGRSKLSKFIAKTFREKILKEKTAKDSPLKAYEIAEAGVSGLNRLLGWEMALDERNDENGKLKSVYFSSKILKFNAPVKKSEPLP